MIWWSLNTISKQINSMNRQEFEIAIKQNFKNIPNDFFEKIETYKKFLQAKNQEFNLTNLAKEELIYQNYFFDSIIPYKNVDFNKIKSVLDIGSGSGIPGVLLKLMFREINLTLIEATEKKAKFIQNLANELNLEQVNVIHKRAEDIKQDEYESFDIVTSRAVAELKAILEISVPYAKTSGLIVEPKSRKFKQEFEASKRIIKELDITLKNEEEFEFNGTFHHVFIFKKNKNTNRKYPRNWKQIVSGK